MCEGHAGCHGVGSHCIKNLLSTLLFYCLFTLSLDVHVNLVSDFTQFAERSTRLASEEEREREREITMLFVAID